MDIIKSIMVIIISYLLGSLSFSLILSKLFYNEDVRNYGSKNAGATNMMRTYGWEIALLTIFGDMAKGVVAVIIGNMLCGQMFGYIAGLFCILGHMFPIFYNFKGGKGVATGAAVAFMTNYWVFLVMFLIFISCIILTKYVSFGSCVTAFAFPFLTFYNMIGSNHDFYSRLIIIITSIIITSLIIWKHQANIIRIKNKTESKISFVKTIH